MSAIVASVWMTAVSSMAAPAAAVAESETVVLAAMVVESETVAFAEKAVESETGTFVVTRTASSAVVGAGKWARPERCLAQSHRRGPPGRPRR